jgi:hypothetical protein
MAVTKVTGDWEHQTVREEVVVGSNQMPKIVMTTGCAFDVEFDNADDPAKRPLLARIADDGTTKVPFIWAAHPYDEFLFVKSKSVEVVGPVHFRVMVNYDCTLDITTQTPISPLLQQPEVSWTFAGSNVPIDTDTEGIPVTNSAAESFDPPITKDYSDLVLRYSRNERTYDKLVAADYKDAVNSDTFLGFGPGHVLCSMFEADMMRAATLTYYKVRYEFRVRYDQVKTRDANGDVQTMVFGWTKRIRDEGFRERTGETNPDGSPKYKEFTDENGQKLSQPHLLDGSGKKLSDAAIAAPPLPETCFLKFDVLKKRPFAALNI